MTNVGPHSSFQGLKHKLLLKDSQALKLRKHRSNDLWLEHMIDSWKDFNEHYKIMGSYALSKNLLWKIMTLKKSKIP
jgi:hypothetical protein